MFQLQKALECRGIISGCTPAVVISLDMKLSLVQDRRILRVRVKHHMRGIVNPICDGECTTVLHAQDGRPGQAVSTKPVAQRRFGSRCSHLNEDEAEAEKVLLQTFAKSPELCTACVPRKVSLHSTMQYGTVRSVELEAFYLNNDFCEKLLSEARSLWPARRLFELCTAGSNCLRAWSVPPSERSSREPGMNTGG